MTKARKPPNISLAQPTQAFELPYIYIEKILMTDCIPNKNTIYVVVFAECFLWNCINRSNLHFYQDELFVFSLAILNIPIISIDNLAVYLLNRAIQQRRSSKYNEGMTIHNFKNGTFFIQIGTTVSSPPNKYIAFKINLDTQYASIHNISSSILSLVQIRYKEESDILISVKELIHYLSIYIYVNLEFWVEHETLHRLLHENNNMEEKDTSSEMIQ
ncbi:hypothetical protein ACJX0J_009455 [Zea mays]